MLRISAVRSSPAPLPPATVENIDRALIVLRDTTDPLDARFALELVKSAPRETVKQRMAVVRPVPAGLVDPLAQSLVHPPRAHDYHDTAIVFQCAGDPKYHAMTQRAIDLLHRYARCKKSLIVVLCGERAWHYFRNREDVLPIRMTLLGQVRTWMKSAMYCVPDVVNAGKFLLLESDMAPIRALADVWPAIDIADPNTIFGAKPQYYKGFRLLTDELVSKGCPPSDLSFVTGGDPRVDNSPFTFNGGTLAGTRQAFAAIAAIKRGFAPFMQLACEGSSIPYADELYTMAAINHNGYISHLGPEWNHHFTSFTPDEATVFDLNVPITGDSVRVSRDGRPSRILHFVGSGKHALLPQLWDNLDRLPVSD